MTRERELLLESLRLIEWHEAQRDEPCEACRDASTRIRALLDEPEREPEYVWRVTGKDTGRVYSRGHGTPPERYAIWTGYSVERAPIGKWEVVE